MPNEHSQGSAENDSHGSPSQSDRTKIVVGVIVAALIATAMVVFRDKLSLEYMAGQEAAFREYQQQHPVLVYGIAFAVYVAVTALSLPGAAALTILAGWLFPWWKAIVLVSFASTTGATLAFLISRYLFRDAVKSRFGERLKKFNEALDKEGAIYLFTLRLIPAVPFFVINAVMGLTPLKTGTFWMVSQLGMLPGTALYTYAGNAVPDLQTLADEGAGAAFQPGTLPKLVIAFGLLGLFPLLAKWTIAKVRPPTENSESKKSV